MKLQPLMKAIADMTRKKLGITDLINPQDLPRKVGEIRTHTDGSLPTYSGSNVVIPSEKGATLSTNDKYMGTDIYVRGDRNFIAENIKKDVTIWGIKGIYESLPYKSLDFIELGEGKYIDTYYNLNPYQDKIELNLNVTKTYGQGMYLFGSANINDTSQNTSNYISGSNLRLDWVGNFNTSINILLNKNYNIILDKTGETIDGTKYNISRQKYNGKLSVPFILGKAYANGIIDNTFINGIVKFYSTKIWSNGVLTKDLIPAQVGNGKGMWDKIENKFYPIIGA